MNKGNDMKAKTKTKTVYRVMNIKTKWRRSCPTLEQAIEASKTEWGFTGQNAADTIIEKIETKTTRCV